ncbi:choice-of-anchor I family protein [Aphanizomenon sp. CS-733/32]|uniref:choice-of-anchor I family protein n=1 Tax=Aphanizomenon sp. CS-733/32 TaxID=3021715 RepID=UPI0023300D73|nr:choice-of-anchor I family protein [Aphanizomenon sp. CS-733/32]MDB9309593.1 choice-of-anchor I family protein [Aphanizomenon sp. CS-733/32]
MALTTGNIAFVGYNADGNDNIAFVALVDINPNEVIIFEDNEWNGTAWVDTNEGAFSWTATSLVTAGTIVRIDNIGSGTISASTGTVVDASVLSPSRGTNRGIGAGDEIIYAYQGSAASPTFITAIASGGFNATNGLLTNTGLTAGLNALDLSTLDDDADVGAFNGLRNGQTNFAAYLPIINNPTNWIAQDGTGDQSIDSTAPDVPFSSTAFTLSVVASGITLTQTGGTTNVTEGGTTDSYTIVLNSQPTADVAIALNAGTQVTTSTNSLTFTPANWNVAQTVTVTAVDDAVVEGSHNGAITHSVTSTDAQYNNITIAQIAVGITDNDFPVLPTVNLAVSSNTTAESSRNQITVTATLSAAVSGNQTVTLNVGGTGITPSDYSLSTRTLTIPNGQTTATATFVATDDGIAEGTETAVLSLSSPSSGIALGTTTTQNIAITNNGSSLLTKIGGFTSSNGGEIPAFDPISDRLFVVAGSVVEILDLSNPASPSKIGDLAFNTSGDPDGTTAGGFTLIPNSVAVGKLGTVSAGIVAVAIAITNQTTADDNAGEVQFFNAATGAFISKVNVGFLPDMLTFTPDGTKVLTANEGQPNNAYTTDPVGSVSIINLAGGVATPTVQEASFTPFNSQINALKASGVRIFGPGSSVAQDVEPEYISFSGDATKAWVTLQENNAIAVVDIATATVESILPLGVKDYNNSVNTTNPNALDTSDRDVNGTSAGGGKIAIQNWPVFGLYQPDAIASYTVNGQTYYVTANEGDARDYAGFSEEVSVSILNLDPTAFPDGATLKLPQNLGRLLVTNTLGDTDGDGDYDQIYTFGGRSFTIWDSAGKRVYDSGAEFERITAAALPGNYNSNNDSNNFDDRSDNKGPEPEGVVIGAISDRIYAFIGLERVGGVMVYEVTNPNSPQFVQYVNTRDFSVNAASGLTDSGPEGLTFISANDSPNSKPLLVVANEISKTTAIFEVNTPSRISDIQGTGHTSPFVGQVVTAVPGIVTAVDSNGFYLQDPNPDTNIATSEAIFVFTSSAPTVKVADSITVTGTVSEFTPGGVSTGNLSTTQIGGNPTITILSSNNPLPAATIIGAGGRIPPTQIIDDDGLTSFDPTTDGIDFFESLEGMRVTAKNLVAVSPTNSFGEIYTVVDNGVGATGLSQRGTINISPNDFNPERIQIDADNGVFDFVFPNVNVGAKLGDVTGVVGYNFGNFEIIPTEAFVSNIQPSTLQPEVTTLNQGGDTLVIATYNILNLDPNDADGNTDIANGRFTAIAQQIVNHLKNPDIIGLQEIQDNSGSSNNGIVSASVTLQTLIDAIVTAGGPTYKFIDNTFITNNTNGGEPGANIRNAYLYNDSRVSLVAGSVKTVPASSFTAFTDSRLPLIADFTFNGEEVTVINNHFSSKGGSRPLFGVNQPSVGGESGGNGQENNTINGSLEQRRAQAEAVKGFVDSVFATKLNPNVVVVGDFNEFEFISPLNILAGSNLTNLSNTLPENERYTYIFDGNSQSLDHILVSNNLSSSAQVDIVHVNSEFVDNAQRASDHDPILAALKIAPSTAQLPNVDLSTYVRVGRYDLPEPKRTTPPTNSLLAQEVSAVTYNWDTDTLFVVGDGSTSIVQVSKTGQLINSMTLAPGTSPQGTDFYDTEGLTYVGGGQFVLIEERDRQASLFTYTAGTTLTKSNVKTVKLGTTVGNIGIEGISWDLQTNGFIAVKEITPEGIFQTTIDFVAGTASNGSSTTVNSTDLFDPAKAGIADFADVFALSNLSALNGKADSSNILILSQESGKIVKSDRAGNISSSLTIVSDPGNPLSIADQQHEGLTMDKDGYLYIVSENGGGDIDHPQLWVYAPSTAINQAPTAVVLNNKVNEIAENTSTSPAIKVADITITDDGLGTNTLSLTGTDASSFEITNNGLFIKTGTTLDFETKTSYSVNVNVDDTTVGNTPDATTAFTLAVTDVVNETPTNSSIFITEVAPWSSGNSPVAADWFELTNKGTSAVNITGWKFDDNSNSFASAVALSGITSIGAGESVIFIEGATINTNFRPNWFGANPPANLQIGNYTGSGVGLSTSGDAVNIYNAIGVLQANVVFAVSPAGPFATFDNAALLNNATISTLSAAGVNGAFVAVNSNAEIGSPGRINAPATSGITLTQTGGTTNVTEGGATDSYTIVLNSQPTADVAIAINPNSQLTTSAVTLTFTPANWNVAQNVTVTALDDVLVEGSHSGEITHSVTSTDAQYNNITINPIVVSITDNVNDAPTLANTIADQNAKQGDAFSFQIPTNTFTDIDAGDVLTYSATLENGNALPSWLTFNPTTRTFSGTPTNDNVGNLNVKVTATDKAGTSANDIFVIAVENINDAPILSNAIADQTVKVNSTFTFTLPKDTFSDPDAVNPYKNLVIFGDSLSDTGNFYKASGNTFPAPPNYQGRASNGLIWVDYLAPDLQFTNPSIQNYAFFGANTGVSNTFGQITVPGLLTQIQQFTTVNANSIGKDGLYVIWAGANDFLNLATDPTQAVTNAVRNISSAIATLAGLGAQEIIVGNLADLGATPLSIAGNNVANAKAISLGFNTALNQALTNLEPSLNVNLSLVNIFGLSTAVQTNPANYKFTNITQPLITATNPVNPDQYAFWDDVHPTTRLHQLVTDTFENTLLNDGVIPDLIKYSATLADGSNLPDWLNFNSTTRTFSGTPNTGNVGKLDVKVIATDKAGATVNDIFTLAVNQSTTVGTPGDDKLIATPGSQFDGQNNIVFTGAGKDEVDLSTVSVFSNSGDNIVDLGSGNDTIFVNKNDRVFGSDGNDTFFAQDSQGGNRISGGVGDDTFYLGSNDRALGGDGKDIFRVSLGGGNLISGGAGTDQFWIVNAELPKATNTVLDFQLGTDVIGIQGAVSLGITTSTLQFNQVGADTAIVFNNQTLATLTGIQASSLSLTDSKQFVFA